MPERRNSARRTMPCDARMAWAICRWGFGLIIDTKTRNIGAIVRGFVSQISVFEQSIREPQLKSGSRNQQDTKPRLISAGFPFLRFSKRVVVAELLHDRTGSSIKVLKRSSSCWYHFFETDVTVQWLKVERVCVTLVIDSQRGQNPKPCVLPT